MKTFLRGLAAMIVGYGVIVALTTLGFTVWMNDRPLHIGGPLVLAQGVVVAVVSGLAGGLAAGFIGPKRGLANAALVLLPLLADSIYVIFFFEGGRGTPTWLDVLGSATLMLTALLGGYLEEKATSPPTMVKRTLTS